MNSLDEPAWGSWMLPLTAALTVTQGAVLEVGIGDWSTPYLHRYCTATGRRLLSIDDDRAFVGQFVGMCNEKHEVRAVRYDDELPRLAEEKWAVVFLDQSPGHRRGADALLFADTAEFIVVHDYSGDEQFVSFDPLITRWSYRRVFQGSPTTLILSDGHGHNLEPWEGRFVPEGRYMHRLRLTGDYPVGVR